MLVLLLCLGFCVTSTPLLAASDPVSVSVSNVTAAVAPSDFWKIEEDGILSLQEVSPPLQGPGNLGAGSGQQTAASLSDRAFVQRIAESAERWGVKNGYDPAGSGPVQGSVKHAYSKRLLERYQKLTNQKTDLLAEQSYLGRNPKPKPYGTQGSARPDVYNPITGEIFDYKFTRNPNPQISLRQQARNLTNVPFVTRQTAIHP